MQQNYISKPKYRITSKTDQCCGFAIPYHCIYLCDFNCLWVVFITLTGTSLIGKCFVWNNWLSQFTYHVVTILVNNNMSTAMYLAWEGKEAYAIHGVTHGPCFNNICNVWSASVSGIQTEALLKRAWCFWKCSELPLESNGLTGTKLLSWVFLGGDVGVGVVLYVAYNCICAL